MNKENLEARRKAKRQAKNEARITAEKNQKPVKSITISIEWKKSRTWGTNPHAEAQVVYHDGTHEHRGGYTCSGCGYDKESTVIANIFNDFFKYKLWNKKPEELEGGHGSNDKGPAPYGICVFAPDLPHYAGGIGTNCYYRIAEFIGGQFSRIASGNSFDVYEYKEV
jgi:hypothetical protein